MSSSEYGEGSHVHVAGRLFPPGHCMALCQVQVGGLFILFPFSPRSACEVAGPWALSSACCGVCPLSAPVSMVITSLNELLLFRLLERRSWLCAQVKFPWMALLKTLFEWVILQPPLVSSVVDIFRFHLVTKLSGEGHLTFLKYAKLNSVTVQTSF